MRASLRDLVDRSAVEYARSYEHASTDSEAWADFSTSCADLVGSPHAVIVEAFWLGRWREQAFPRVVIGPRRAASLMSTGVAAEQMVAILPPWKAFLVELTDSPLSIRDPAVNGAAPIDRIEVHYSTHHAQRPAWTMVASTAHGTSLQRFNVFSPDWINDRLVFEGPCDPYSTDCDAEDLRALSLLSRLVAGLCLSLSAPEQREDAAKRGTSKSYRKRRRGPPMVIDYVLGDDVRIDVCDAIGEYVARGGRAPKVQSLVRGHWKMQPHGKDRALRKWLHIEPYWRGPEDAPVAMRRHRVIE